MVLGQNLIHNFLDGRYSFFLFRKIISLSQTERRELLEELLGFTKFDLYLEIAKSNRVKTEQNIDRIIQQIIENTPINFLKK